MSAHNRARGAGTEMAVTGGGGGGGQQLKRGRHEASRVMFAVGHAATWANGPDRFGSKVRSFWREGEVILDGGREEWR